MFRYRLLSALAGIPIILGALFWSEWSFFALVMVIMLASLLEFVKVFGSLPKSWAGDKSKALKTFTLLFFYPPYITASFIALLVLRFSSVWWTFMVITATWVYDTAAYGFGIWLGKHKLAPKISPDKSWEGTIGGILATVLYLALLSYFKWLSLSLSLALGLLISVAALLGDLMESRFKRYANIKDTSKIIPGHGGFLDRFDSLMLVSFASFWFFKLVAVR